MIREERQPLIESIGDYRPLEYLASGSSADAYRVAAPDGKEYALKWLKAAADTTIRSRFENEKWALGRLNHPAIPKLIFSDEWEGRPYLVESLAPGKSLRKYWRKQCEEGGTSTQFSVLRTMGATLEALAYIHHHQVVHRDVKDDNVILADSGELTLVDFGFCKGSGQPVEPVPSDWFVGAARYSPLAKLKHPTHSNPTHDVFAVGVIGYLLLTNFYPWDFVEGLEDVGHLRERMSRQPLVSVAHINTMVRKEVAQFLADLLVLDDDTRPTASAAKIMCDDLIDKLKEPLALQISSQHRRVSRLEYIIPTRYVATFPDHLKHVIELVEEARTSVSVVVDCVDHGAFSAPEFHEDVVRAIEDARRKRHREVHLLIAGGPAHISRTSPYANRDFDTDLSRDRAFLKVLEHYCEFHGRRTIPIDGPTFKQMLLEDHEMVERRLRRALVDIVEVPRAHSDESVLFFWLQDGDDALFSFPTKPSQFLRTHDVALVTHFGAIVKTLLTRGSD